MLYNLAKMSITSTSEWPQLEQEASSMVATTKLTEKPPQDRQPLRCPRCDSSNTKFCYYNNYSLTQPRHFCKACKRYWTRGGTLRNVPVGGGCRKNKTIKRPAPADGSNLPPNPSPPDVSRTGANIYGLASTPPNMASFAIPALRSGLPSMNLENYCASISSSGLDVPPQQSSPWLNFPSEKFESNSDDVEYQSGLNPNPNQFQESASLWPDNSTCSASYLLSPTFNEQKLLISLNEKGTPNDLMAFFPVGDHLSVGSTGGSSNILKGVKMEEENASMSNNRTDWQIPCNSSIDNIGSNLSSYWNSGMFGPWTEAAGSFTPWH